MSFTLPANPLHGESCTVFLNKVQGVVWPARVSHEQLWSLISALKTKREFTRANPHNRCRAIVIMNKDNIVWM